MDIDQFKVELAKTHDMSDLTTDTYTMYCFMHEETLTITNFFNSFQCIGSWHDKGHHVFKVEKQRGIK